MPFHFASIPSTQSFLKEHVQADPALSHLEYALAEVQTQGVGRMNRAWISDAGNLFLSVWIKEFSLPLTWVPHWVGVTVLESLETIGVGAGHIQLKWPNDLVSVTHAKVAGILCEKVGNGVIAGIGVNLITAPGLTDRETTSVKSLSPGLDYQNMNVKLADQIVSLLRREPRLPGLQERYQEYSVLQPGIKIHWLDLQTQVPGQGTFLNYGEYGEVMVRDELGTVRPLYSEEIKIIL